MRLAFFSLLVLVGCTTVIVPAPAPEDPVNVYVIDHGWHASLVLPHNHTALVRYAYGDWRWYALADEGIRQGIAALFWPTPGALGRQVLPMTPDAATLQSHIVEGAEAILVIPAAAARVQTLRRKLDAIYQSQLATRVYNPLYDLNFIHSPDDYSLFHNSNTVTAHWLEELGCEVRGPTLLSRWLLK